VFEALEVVRDVAISERDAHARIDGKPAVPPGEHVGGGLGVDESPPSDPADEPAAHLLGELGEIGRAGRNATPSAGSVAVKTPSVTQAWRWTWRFKAEPKVLYALHDATATVESIPLITASILSKKLAEGIDALVLDVKCGDGAFMSRIEDARALAERMTRIGRALGKPVQAVLTSMDAPLGRMVGNALEVAESVACLKGEGPDDLMEVSLELAAEMLLVGGVAASRDDALDRCRRSIADGSALERFRRVVVAQWGDGQVCDEPEQILPRATSVEIVRAERSGYLHELKAWSVKQGSMLLGAGRRTAEDSVDPAAGIMLHRGVGDRVAAGDVLAELHFNPPYAAAVPEAVALFRGAVGIGGEPVARPSLILERL
jgi:pyrimidine-nucleoside phosphorylase/thymidine phosphorylase